MKITPFLVIVSILLGCNFERIEEQNYLNKPSAFEIKLDQIEEKEFFELFELQEILELKLSDDFFITDIYRMKVYDNEFFVFDESMQNLIRYNRNGVALNRIGEIGDGPNEIPQIADFSIDRYGNIYLASGVAMKIAKYSKNGEYLSSIKLEDQMDQITIAGGKFFTSLTYFNNLNKNLGVFGSTGDTLKTFFPFEKGIFPIMLKNISGHLTTNAFDNVLFNESASSRIYEINEELNITPKYQFISKSDLWQESDRHQLNPFFEKLATAELTFLTRFYEESDSYFFFSLNKKQVGIKRFIIDPRIGFFDKKSKTSLLSKKAEFLIHLKGPLYSENDAFYLYAPKFELKKIVSTNSEWANLEKFIDFKFTEKEDFDSPVLLKFKVLQN
jgi:hypothetical protein